MQPKKAPVTHLFNAPYQYQIPVFQRGYVWTLEKQLVPLWADIVDRAVALEDRMRLVQIAGSAPLKPLQKHFLGSIVMSPTPSTFGRVGGYEVIDGQQRTTTLHLLLLALRHATRQVPDSPLPQMLDVLIRNPGPYSVPSDHFKVWPTQAGRNEIEALNAALSVEEIYERFPARQDKKRVDRPLMVQAYIFLYHASIAFLRGVDLADPVDATSERTHSDSLVAAIRTQNIVNPIAAERPLIAERAQLLYVTLDEYVQLMTLSLDPEDDPQVIFETLNARGEPLLASDLVRNFVFLQAARDGLPVADLYAKYWQHFDEQRDQDQVVTANRYWREKERQGRLVYPRIDLFFFHYTVLRSRQETLATHVFHAFKEWWQGAHRDLDAELAQIVRVSQHFRDFITPCGSDYVAEFARLVKALDLTSILPVYLALRERFAPESAALRQALGDIASYLVRRAVCGYTTKNYNRIFMRLLDAICQPTASPEQSLREELLRLGGASQAWPSDEEFSEHWLGRAVYKELRPAKVCGVLRALEYATRGSLQGFHEVPAQSSLTVEHVLPQSWRSSENYPLQNSSPERVVARDQAIHRFGNLTLLTQKLNSTVGNIPFLPYFEGQQEKDGKRKGLANSGLLIGTYFNDPAMQEWNDEAIEKRGRAMLRAALMVWPRSATSLFSPNAVLAALQGKHQPKKSHA